MLQIYSGKSSTVTHRAVRMLKVSDIRVEQCLCLCTTGVHIEWHSVGYSRLCGKERNRVYFCCFSAPLFEMRRLGRNLSQSSKQSKVADVHKIVQLRGATPSFPKWASPPRFPVLGEAHFTARLQVGGIRAISSTIVLLSRVLPERVKSTRLL